jgi:uncharacterized protein
MRGPREPLDVDRLSREGAEVDFAIELSELAGLRTLRAGVAGSVRGHVRFGREQEFNVAELSFSGTAVLECQRCMGPMERTLEVLTRVALVPTEEEAAGVPPELEPVLAGGGRISIEQLLSEELLLTLPIVPLHEGAGSCTATRPQAREGETHKPFARLAELVKR